MTIAWYHKINPLWWFGNRDEPLPPDWYLPAVPMWGRIIGWYWRNPIHNFVAYVVGVQDREFTWVASKPNTVDKPFADGGGLMTAWLTVGWLRLPYVSYQGAGWQFYLGWHPSGKLGAALRKHTPAVPTT
jgi:hypothetical protein